MVANFLRQLLWLTAWIAVAFPFCRMALGADRVDTLALDWAYYNPVSLVLKDKGWLEDDLKPLGVGVRWVQSLGSNKALEFLNAGVARLRLERRCRRPPGPRSTPTRSGRSTSTASPSGRRSSPGPTPASPRSRTCAASGSPSPAAPTPTSSSSAPWTRPGCRRRTSSSSCSSTTRASSALERKDVDAWAGLDPMMAQTELEAGNKLFYRDADANTYGVLDVREAFVEQHPDLVARVIAVYEKGRRWSLENKAGLTDILAKAAKLTPEVAARQVERTDLSNPRIEAARATIVAAGKALQDGGVIKPDVNVEAVTDQLIDTRFSAQLAANGQ